jgi:hypothetical protein
VSNNNRGSLVETGPGLTRTITLIALTCFLVLGAAAASIFARDSVPSANFDSVSAAASAPSSNRESKKDKLTPAVLASAQPDPDLQSIPEPMRQAFASDSPVNTRSPLISAPMTAPPKPKVAQKPAVQKSYALLSDVQIAGIKERMKLDTAQESYWPAVEVALRAVARRIHATRQGNPNASGTALIDPDSAEVQQLKSAAMPLLFQLREDQKREVRSLANLIGLGAVASMI